MDAEPFEALEKEEEEEEEEGHGRGRATGMSQQCGEGGDNCNFPVGGHRKFSRADSGRERMGCCKGFVCNYYNKQWHCGMDY